MKAQEIYEKIKSGLIKLNTCGHKIQISKLINDYENSLALANGQNDNKWSNDRKEPIEKINEQMREFYRRPLEKEINVGETLWVRDAEICKGCCERINWVLTAEDTLSAIEYPEYIKDFQYRLIRTPIDYVCPYGEQKTFSGEITISSKLVFTNFFRHVEDTPEECKHSGKWSLCYDIGLDNITTYLAEKNIAFGQMGNMAISLFVNADRTSIIVGSSYHPAELEEYDSDEEYFEAIKKQEFEGYERIDGKISLEVWRWMATDVATLGDHYHHLNDDYRQDIIELEVPHGVWKFEHFYSNQTNPNKGIYSMFTLKESK